MFVVRNAEVVLCSRASNYSPRCIIAAPITRTEKSREHIALLRFDLQSFQFTTQKRAIRIDDQIIISTRSSMALRKLRLRRIAGKGLAAHCGGQGQAGHRPGVCLRGGRGSPSAHGGWRPHRQDRSHIRLTG